MATTAHTETLARPSRSIGSYVMPAIATLLVALLVLVLVLNFIDAPAYFINISFIGLTNGAVYALVALGYTLVYGILELINFAHGDVFMLGGMFAATMILSVFHLKAGESAGSLAVAIVCSLFVAMAACGLINITIERVAYRPLRHAPRLAPLITAIGMSFILEDIAIAWKGPSYVGRSVGAPARQRVLDRRRHLHVGEADRRHHHDPGAAAPDVAGAAARDRARRCGRRRRTGTRPR